MQASQRMTRLLLTLIALVTLTATALAAEPGALFPANAGPNDVRPGSVLVYNYYTSTGDGSTTDTTINITNASPTEDSYVHLFFVDGMTCSIADVSICLTQNQTASFRASDLDPGTTGYLIAVGFGPSGDNGNSGCPSSRLIGSARLRVGAGVAMINALAIDGANTGECRFSDSDGLLTISVRVPLVLAVDSVMSVADARTFIVLNRIGGNFATGPGAIGSLFGLFFNDREIPYSFGLNAPGCQYRANLAAGTPRTTPPITSIIPSGQTGWMKFWSTAGRGVTGAVFEFASDGSSIGGRNMHALTTTAETITIPFFGNQCF